MTRQDATRQADMMQDAIPDDISGEAGGSPHSAQSTRQGAREPAGLAPRLIEIRGLRKSYAEAAGTRTVLSDLDLDLYAGEFVCLLGKSGSGKSTLLNLISGIDAPDAGRVTLHVDGAAVNLTGLSERERTLLRRRNIGIVFQFFNLIPTLTVVENVRLPLELAGRADAGAAAEMLDAVGLGDRLNTYPDRLSGGEQQRVAIARALIHDPLLILADEPTGNLDDDTGESVLGLLLRLTRDAGKTLIMATHAPEIARRADRVLHVVHGHLEEAHLEEAHLEEAHPEEAHPEEAHLEEARRDEEKRGERLSQAGERTA